MDAGTYGFTVYSGSDAVATVSGAGELGSEEWMTLEVSDASIVSGLSSGLSGVAFQVDAPTSGSRLEWSWVRMVVDYEPSGLSAIVTTDDFARHSPGVPEVFISTEGWGGMSGGRTDTRFR